MAPYLASGTPNVNAMADGSAGAVIPNHMRHWPVYKGEWAERGDWNHLVDAAEIIGVANRPCSACPPRRHQRKATMQRSALGSSRLRIWQLSVASGASGKGR